jgi:aryl-alcohol dehydrogenase-like predicted oxidoreductase
MKTRSLGKSGFEVSEIGLGCWQLGGDFGPVADETAQKILAAAHKVGIDFWDTADVYGGGQSESRIAQYVAEHQPGAIIATKVGRDGALYPDGYTKEKVRVNLQGSAQRLGVDTLDLVQLHCVPPEVLKAGDIFAWLEDYQDEGLIRHFGASVETLDEALLAATHPDLTSLQIIFNVFRQSAIADLFPIAQANDIGVIVRLPLASGVLSGKMSKDHQFAESDHRLYNRHGEAFSQGETFSGVPFEMAVDFVEELKSWLPSGMTMAQMAMRWILDFPAVTTVIAGASRPGQVVENASVSDLPSLSQDHHQKLATFYDDKVEAHICGRR